MFTIKQKLITFVQLLFVAALVIVVFAHESIAETDNAPNDNALAHDTLPFYSSADLRPRWNRAQAVAIGDIALRDQHDNLLDEDWFKGEPTVVNFFFSQCTTVCPVSMEMLGIAQKNMAGNSGANPPLPELKFLSISVTPALDTPPTLANYAARIGLPADWRLTTGAPKDVYRLARESLFTDIETPAFDGGPPHTERALLIDTKRRIRGIYDATQPTELLRLRNDVERLQAE